MSRPYDVSDFSRLLEKTADDRPLGRSRWSSGRQRGEARPEREEVVRERLANRYRKTYQDRTRNYALRESEIFMLKELGKFRVISAEDLEPLPEIAPDNEVGFIVPDGKPDFLVDVLDILLSDEDRLRRFQYGAWQHYTHHHSPKVVAQSLEAVFRQILG